MKLSLGCELNVWSMTGNDESSSTDTLLCLRIDDVTPAVCIELELEFELGRRLHIFNNMTFNTPVKDDVLSF